MTSAARKKKSKKPSGSNSTSKPLEQLVFFVDASLGSAKVPNALIAAGANVRILINSFPPDTADEVWLKAVGERGWIVVTNDKNIKRRPLEMRALLQAGVKAFVLTATDLTGEEMGQVLGKALPRMGRLCKKHRGPFIGRITRKSEVDLIDIAKYTRHS